MKLPSDSVSMPASFEDDVEPSESGEWEMSREKQSACLEEDETSQSLFTKRHEAYSTPDHEKMDRLTFYMN